MPEAYTHIRIARAALAQSGEHAPSTAAYEMGANGPDPLFAYRVLSAKRPWPLPELGGRIYEGYDKKADYHFVYKNHSCAQ